MLKVNMKVAIVINEQYIPVYEIDYPFVIEKDVDSIISKLLLKGSNAKLPCVSKVLSELGERISERLAHVKYDEFHIAMIVPHIEILDYEYYLKRLFKRKDYATIDKLMKMKDHDLITFNMPLVNKEVAEEFNYKIKGE